MKNEMIKCIQNGVTHKDQLPKPQTIYELLHIKQLWVPTGVKWKEKARLNWNKWKKEFFDVYGTGELLLFCHAFF